MKFKYKGLRFIDHGLFTLSEGLRVLFVLFYVVEGAYDSRVGFRFTRLGYRI